MRLLSIGFSYVLASFSFVLILMLRGGRDRPVGWVDISKRRPVHAYGSLQGPGKGLAFSAIDSLLRFNSKISLLASSTTNKNTSAAKTKNFGVYYPLD